MTVLLVGVHPAAGAMLGPEPGSEEGGCGGFVVVSSAAERDNCTVV